MRVIRKEEAKLDVRGIVNFFGGRSELVRQLKQFDIVEITPDAVSKWQLRGAIPRDRLADLRALASKAMTRRRMASLDRLIKQAA